MVSFTDAPIYLVYDKEFKILIMKKVSKYLLIPLFVIAFVYTTIFGFDYVILAFLIFLLITTIAKNFAK